MSSTTSTDASDARAAAGRRRRPRARGVARSPGCPGSSARSSRSSRKVIWPTRKELVTYTAVVIVFVSVMCALVTVLDIGFGKLVTWVFG